MQEDTLQQLINLNSIKLQATRHIASHDYESVSFEIIYKRCLQLVNNEVLSELKAFVEGDFNANS